MTIVAQPPPSTARLRVTRSARVENRGLRRTMVTTATETRVKPLAMAATLPQADVLPKWTSVTPSPTEPTTVQSTSTIACRRNGVVGWRIGFLGDRGYLLASLPTPSPPQASRVRPGPEPSGIRA